MKSTPMKMRAGSSMCGWIAGGLCASFLPVAQAQITYEQTFTTELPLTAGAPDGLLLNPTWNIQQYTGQFELLTVDVRLVVSVSYSGTVLSPAASENFQIQVGGDFSLAGLMGGTGGAIPLQAFVNASGTTGDAGSPFSVEGPAGAPIVGTAQTDASLQRAPYAGSGVVPVSLSGLILRTNPNGSFSDITDTGSFSEAVFSNNPKVRAMEGLQAYGLTATLIVTYGLPEVPAAWPVAALLVPVALYQWRKRSRSKASEDSGEQGSGPDA